MKKYKEFILEKKLNTLIESIDFLSSEKISEIVNGYLEAALWTEEERLKEEYNDSFEDYDFEDYDFEDSTEEIIKKSLEKETNEIDISFENVDVDSKIEAYLDIQKFIENAGYEAIIEAIDKNGLNKLGMDIWLTRNRHGSGFFDHGYENEEILINSAEKLGKSHIFIDNNGKIIID
jgi:hypothetical protein